VLDQAIDGGVDCVQLREKEMNSRELFEWGKQVQALCKTRGVPLVVNDNVEVTMALGAAGVHLGQEDMHVEDARKLLGNDFLIGLSTHTLEEADDAFEFGADYAGFGPIFASSTRGNEQGLGPEHLAATLAIARLPILAIGGIQPENCWMIPEQAGIATSSGICSADNPMKAAKALLNRESCATP
jgi:thiamine-phosphate pyrophosphorylase